jgi:hypothetical protein
MKIRPVGAELLYAARRTQTDRHDEVYSRFSHFANPPTNKLLEI